MEGMKWSVAGDEVELAPARVQEGEVVEQVVPAQGEVELAVVCRGCSARRPSKGWAWTSPGARSKPLSSLASQTETRNRERTFGGQHRGTLLLLVG